MFADIVGYTTMMQQDEIKARQSRARHRAAINEQVTGHSGEVVQYYGDGALSIFPSAKEAIKAALAIQLDLGEEPPVPVRIGIHLGDILQDEEGIFGDSVNVAARVESMAVAGSILFSDKIYREISNHPDIQAKSLGLFELKNVKKPVEIYALCEQRIKIPQPGELDFAKGKTVAQSIAVMPFTNMSDPNCPDYFADGVSEEIINGLSRVEGVNVISRSTCQSILKSQEDRLQTGRNFKVSHFLEGSVRRAGERVRMSVQLVNTDDGFQLWAESYDRNLDDIFRVQDEIARKVISKLKVSFDLPADEDTIVSEATENMEAYNQYLRGLHHLKRGNPEDVKKAVTHFENALSIDPGFASAECSLSRCYSFLGSCGVIPPVSAYAKALKSAMSSIEKNSDFAEGHLAMANIKFYHFWDWEGTRESLEKAEELGLNSAEFYESYGLYYAAKGRSDLGIPKMLKALELNPLSLPVMTMLGTLYLFDEQFEKAVALYDEILELEPNHRAAYNFKGVALGCLGRHREALGAFELYHQAVNHPQKALLGLVISHYRLGNHEKVEELIGRLYERLENDYTPAVEVDLAICHAGTEEYDKSIEYLDSLYEKRLSIACMGMIWVMRCPYFKGLWSHPGYKRLMEKMEMA